MNTMNTVEKKRKPKRVVSVRAKAQAVLAIWSGRRNTSQVCRELGVYWGSVDGWERKGLQGIHKAMGGEELTSPVPGELGRRLEGLLAGLATEKTVLPGSLVTENQG